MPLHTDRYFIVGSDCDVDCVCRVERYFRQSLGASTPGGFFVAWLGDDDRRQTPAAGAPVAELAGDAVLFVLVLVLAGGAELLGVNGLDDTGGLADQVLAGGRVERHQLDVHMAGVAVDGGEQAARQLVVAHVDLDLRPILEAETLETYLVENNS
jgi:hypothetical protein